MRIRSFFLIIGFILIPVLLNGCVQKHATTLIFGSYTTPREAYRRIIPLFQEYWQQKTGQWVEVRQSYSGSGAQSRNIRAGFEADVAALSVAADIDDIQKQGLITHDWRERPNRGIVTTSIVVLVDRNTGGSEGLEWQDLVSAQREILTPDPRASGGAMWNMLAAYGAAKRGHVPGYAASDSGARAFLKDLLRNVKVFDKGARESITSFERGVGNVLVTSESEVVVGRQAGEEHEYYVPQSTLLIENPVAVVDAYADKHGVREIAEAFVEFLWTPQAQRIFVEHGFRPMTHGKQEFIEIVGAHPEIDDLWTIDYLGGWEEVMPRFFGQEGLLQQALMEIHEEG